MFDRLFFRSAAAAAAMMLRATAAIALIGVFQASSTRAELPYEAVWSRQIGTSGHDHGHSIAVDASGNAYICGDTRGSLGGPTAGGRDAFLLKYDGSGSLLWSQQIGTWNDDYGYSVAVDASGNAYITGNTEGSLPEPTAGGRDAFLAKYDGSGSLLWSQRLGTSGNDSGRSVAVDAFGNAYITGSTEGSLAEPNAGHYDAFLAKYDGSGSLLWSQQIGTPSGDYGTSVAVDASGNAYISGSTDGSLGGPNAGDGGDAFLLKYDGSGNLLWSQQIGTPSGDYGYGVAVDAFGNAYISGYTHGSLGGPNAGGYDTFLVKYDGSGSLLWSQQIGTSSHDYGRSVALDASGNAYITGSTEGSLTEPNAGYYDAFLAKYDGSGSLLWSQQIGTSRWEYGESVALDAFGNAYITGNTEGSLGGPNAGGNDAFLVKLSPVPEPSTFALLGTAAVVLAGWAWRRRRRA